MSDTIREIEVNIEGAETIRAEKVSDNIYYCLESLVFIELKLYGCEIEVKDEDGKLKFIKIHKDSNYSTHVYLWSKEFLESDGGKKIKTRILEAGGDWEQVMGGILFIYLAKDKDHMLKQILESVE